MRIEDITRDEFSAAMDRDPVVILPLGATEAHGPHLPLGTDSLQPEWVADRLAERIDALVAPPVRYGMHSSTRNMPGTIDLSFETLYHLISDILESLVRNGAKRFLVLSGHAGGSHMTAIKEACRRTAMAYGSRIMFLSDYDLAAELAPSRGVATGDGHGGEVETSRVMHIRPDLVREDRPKGEYISHGYMVLPDPECCFPQGFAGEPGRATAKLGEELDWHVVKRLEELMMRDGL